MALSANPDKDYNDNVGTATSLGLDMQDTARVKR